jgi:stage II sporulation protein D
MQAKETGFYIDSLANALTVTELSPSGTILKAKINNKEYTGEEIRSIFSLRSPVFTVASTENAITFNVLGYGHGIGMSQYGADYFARQGYTYKDILMHYYTGVVVK